MSQATFHAPRRKRKVYECYESPFPIPLSHDNHGTDFRVCRAEIINNFIVVKTLDDILLLYGKGYFGKGILSRSRPEYNIGQGELRGRWKGLAPSKRKLPIISSKKYQLHVEWARSLLEGQGMDRSSTDKILGDYCSPFDFPEDKDDTLDSVDCKAQKELSSTDSSFPADDSTEVLEGNPVFDPLAKYGSEELETQEPCIVPDREVLEKMHCHRHDDLIVHCGCKPEKQTARNNAAEKSVIEREEHEYVLVEEEQDNVGLKDEDVQEDKNEKFKLVCRRNPFQMFEYLQLSREEAFFLVYGLGCLSVSYKKEPLTIQKLWKVFCAAQQNFPTSYMAYHHFRSKGWVPKVGLKYGTDLLLYRKGPPFYHASYSVIVELANANYEGSPLRPLTWRSLSGLNRTTMNVSKELLICYLIQPEDITEKDMKSPECIKKFTVQEVIVSRWISSQERMEHEEL
ncbi:PREDICTED: tRNA-splicing endonuclease subunit Sen2 [Nanorana parkeri]|uniref:tRNA-splicing endonuclease subunit Sen2 n=1 Tax=Nanorana parkeri TaxID=125878 RepID=UPI000854FF06|nr:PREDICTED: tRNA-splicing endonuclease subunit Sen2 [Nanorana parkeri]